MSAMKELEQEIREIVRDEVAKSKDNKSPGNYVPLEARPQQKVWSGFETEYLIESFWEFCAQRALMSGRSVRSISCKIRNLMTSGVISTW